jgi:hypothetical protein
MNGQSCADNARCQPTNGAAYAKDLASGLGSYALVWGIPIAAIVGTLFVDVSVRTPIWIGALIWMGLACMLNARRCGRTHCKFTGPFYVAMVIPVLIPWKHDLRGQHLGVDGNGRIHHIRQQADLARDRTGMGQILVAVQRS